MKWKLSQIYRKYYWTFRKPSKWFIEIFQSGKYLQKKIFYWLPNHMFFSSLIGLEFLSSDYSKNVLYLLNRFNIFYGFILFSSESKFYFRFKHLDLPSSISRIHQEKNVRATQANCKKKLKQFKQFKQYKQFKWFLPKNTSIQAFKYIHTSQSCSSNDTIHIICDCDWLSE